MKKYSKPFVYAVLTFPLITLAACGSVAPKPGTWIIPWISDRENENYTTTVGMFSVSDDSTVIEQILMMTGFWTCGDIEIHYNNIFYNPEGNQMVDTLSWWHASSSIDDGSFLFELPVFVYKDSIINLQSGTFTFAGTFTSSSKVSGTWELDLPSSGDHCAGTWHGVPFVKVESE